MNVTRFNVTPNYVAAYASNVTPFICTTWCNIRHVYFKKHAFATVASVFMPALILYFCAGINSPPGFLDFCIKWTYGNKAKFSAKIILFYFQLKPSVPQVLLRS